MLFIRFRVIFHWLGTEIPGADSSAVVCNTWYKYPRAQFARSLLMNAQTGIIQAFAHFFGPVGSVGSNTMFAQPFRQGELRSQSADIALAVVSGDQRPLGVGQVSNAEVDNFLHEGEQVNDWIAGWVANNHHHYNWLLIVPKGSGIDDTICKNDSNSFRMCFPVAARAL